MSLVEALRLQPLSENLSDSGQIGDGLVVHGLGHEVAMLLRSGTHLDLEQFKLVLEQIVKYKINIST